MGDAVYFGSGEGDGRSHRIRGILSPCSHPPAENRQKTRMRTTFHSYSRGNRANFRFFGVLSGVSRLQVKLARFFGLILCHHFPLLMARSQSSSGTCTWKFHQQKESEAWESGSSICYSRVRTSKTSNKF